MSISCLYEGQIAKKMISNGGKYQTDISTHSGSIGEEGRGEERCGHFMDVV